MRRSANLPSCRPELLVKHRFALDDVVGDGAFLGVSGLALRLLCRLRNLRTLTRPIHQNDRVILVTLHCSLHIYDLVQSDPSPSTSASRFLCPTWTFHAPQRPLLWAARFSKPAYYSASPRAESESNTEEYIRIAGGSMWGDTFLWDVSTAADLLGTAPQDASSVREPIRGSLRRLVGHKVPFPPLRFVLPF